MNGLKGLLAGIALVMSSQQVFALYNGAKMPPEFENTSTVISFSGLKFHCSYTIIHSQYLLTAAHCVDALSEGQFVQSKSSDGSREGRHRIEKIIRKEGYKADYTNIKDRDLSLSYVKTDIALIKLRDPITEYPIKIVPLVQVDQDNLKLPAILLANGFDEYNDELRVGYSKMLPAKLDWYSYRKSNGEVVDLNVLDVLNAASEIRGICHGDSGGAVLIYQNNQWELIGIMASGNAAMGCHKKNIEGMAVPVIDSLTWIKAEMEN